MPRKARIDAPGTLHHVIVRGIERRKIFRSDYDRENFLNRLAKLIPESHTDCFAWAHIPNHGGNNGDVYDFMIYILNRI